MSSTTAHFGLTKAASNERYSLPVVNGNSDIIDTQMYNNQQSAAKLMVGATAQEDGESGRVPAPTSADRGKYLKGDGTWDTPSGGGGSSTLEGLSDVDISSPTNGQALVYDATNQVWINGNVSGGGGSFTETPLFTGGTSGTRTFTLSSAFTNYDYIAIYYSHNDGRTTYQDVKLYPSSLLYSLIGTSVNILGITNDAWYYYFTVTSTTQLDYAKSNAGWITDVIGIKFGGGSSEVSYSTTEHKIGTWIDGSDVYEKTIVLRENDTNNYTYSSSEFSQCLPANINWIDIVSFYSKRNTGGYVDCMNNSSETNIVPNPSNQSIYYQSSHNASDVIVTIRYTKIGGNS